jgi:Domain of unknown function (DUF5103)
MLYPLIGDAKDGGRTLLPAVAQLGSEKFVLEFDDLAGEYQQFHVKILPFTSDWQPQNLSELEYLPEYNDFIINDYQVSQGTKVHFYHYRVELPPVKIAGNYLVVAFREQGVSRTRNRNNSQLDYILSKRCLVYENRINCAATVGVAQDPSKRLTHQQIDLEIAYGNYPIIAPRDELKIVIRQNYRWDRTIQNLKPTSIDEIQQKMTFQFFNNENLFPANNEFRYFDNRSAYNRGMFVQKIIRGKEDEAYLSPAENRSEFAYIEMTDFNGMYVVDNIEEMNDATGADYNMVTLGLKSHELEDGKKVFINAAFNNWRLDKDSEMKYEAEFGGYVGKMYLKQGIYNYNFIVQDQTTKKLDEEYFEGNHSETENAYEVIVYHKPFGSRAEQVISYRLVEFNKRK